MFPIKQRARASAQAWALVMLALSGSFAVAQTPAPTAPAPAGTTAVTTPPVKADASSDDAKGSASEFINGNGNLIGHEKVAHVSTTNVADDGTITLNFVNADVRDVAKAVLGDFLGLNYTISTSVQGAVTVQTSRPLERSQVLPVLEQALRLSGLALIKSDGIYKVLPVADASREGYGSISRHGGASEPGYGVEIVPLKYVGAAQMEHLLEPIGPSQAIVHTDPSRNVLVIEGTQGEREAIVNQIELFDVDWMAGMSFALFTPQYTDAHGLAQELNQILGGAQSPLSGIVRLIPIERLNSVLVISPQPRYLKQVEQWVARLDRPGAGSDRRVYVYAVQNGRASDLAKVLKKVLYGVGKDSGDNSSGDEGDSEQSGLSAPPPPTSGPAGGSTGAPPPPPAHGQGLIVNSEGASSTPPGSASITADEANNAIVVYGTPQQYAVIDKAMRQLDTAPLQVLLEAAIAEVTLTDDLKYGVQYFYQPSDKHSLTLSNSGSGLIASAFPGFSYVFTEGTNIRIILNTLAGITHVEVLSSPELMVLNNRTATLQVGDQVPIETAEATNVTAPGAPIVNSISYQPTGVILKVTPRVNQGGMVMMDVSQEVSDVSNTTTSTLNSPTISQRKIESTVAVQDNETIALGGLITDSRTRGSSGLPFLSAIPVLGGLFGTKQDDHDRTELLVLITPHVVDNLQRARAVTDELRHKLPAVQHMLGKDR